MLRWDGLVDKIIFVCAALVTLLLNDDHIKLKGLKHTLQFSRGLFCLVVMVLLNSARVLNICICSDTTTTTVSLILQMVQHCY